MSKNRKITNRMEIRKQLGCYNDEFQKAFREYFQEFGITLKVDTDIFDELQKECDNQGMQVLLMWEAEKVIGFILYQVEEFSSSSRFFTEKVGYIRELWVKKEYRRRGMATKLIEACFELLNEEGVKKALLTYDEDAEQFYLKLGFVYDSSYTAKNTLRCLIKIF